MGETILCGDVLDRLAELPDESVHCVVTSPPYWGLRDYGTGTWVGGDPDCPHKGEPMRTRAGVNANTGTGTDRKNAEGFQPYGQVCGRCGAERVDQQIGLETSPEEYIERMVNVFREVRRVLRRDGTLWLNMGDAYDSGTRASRDVSRNTKHGYWENPAINQRTRGGLGGKQLLGMPWRLAFALQADGWWLRQDIIWAKPNPMPESVRDRCTKSHEYLFLLTKSARYYYDAEAIAEACSESTHARMSQDVMRQEGSHRAAGGAKTNGPMRAVVRGSTRKLAEEGSGIRANDSFEAACGMLVSNRNRRSVWTIPTQPYAKAHFATFPEALVEPCILAGTSARGCCSQCGAPWRRVVKRSGGTIGKSWHGHSADLTCGAGQDGPQRTKAMMDGTYRRESMGWKPGCDCGLATTTDCVVLDPFLGSGTTAAVARRLGRSAIGIELNPEYVDLARARIGAAQPPLPGLVV